MFKKRALQVRMVKANDNVAEEVNKPNFPTEVAVIAAEVDELAKKAVIGMALFVVLDTGRKVAVALATK